jgi:methanogenic corrinoid protein MtbC1
MEMALPKEPPMDLGSWNETERTQRQGFAPAGFAASQEGAALQGTPMPAARTASAERLEVISRTIEEEVIPRLLQARRAAGVAPADVVPGALAHWTPTEHDVSDLVGMALDRDDSMATHYIDDLAARGVSLETICGALLGPTARRLGVMWEDDEIGFTAVTTAVWRLQQILRAIAPGYTESLARRVQPRHILLVPVVGEQHFLGLAVVAAHFRMEGWTVRTESLASNDELAALVRGDWFDVIGFSAGSHSRLDQLKVSIAQARRASRNLKLGVMVGGPVFLAQPDLVAAVGADATAADGPEAASRAEQLMTFMAQSG